MKKENLDRRNFLKTSIKAVAIGTIALSSLDITKLLASASDKFEESSSPKVIRLSDYPELRNIGGYALITSKVIVIRTSSSKFVALNLTCTHKQCTVEYDGTSFECPCHSSEYDKYGKVTLGPATKNLKSYKTSYSSEDDTLTINM